MSDDYTPTTEQVREAFRTAVLHPDDIDLDDAPGREFDRWLAAHDAGIRAEALAPIRAALAGHPVCDVRPDGGIPSCGWKRAVADVRQALDA